MSKLPDEIDGLSPGDARVLDLLLESGFDARTIKRLPEPDQRRAHAIMSLFGLLEDYPVPEPDETLVHAALARIRTHEESVARSQMGFTAEDDDGSGRARWRFRWPDLISMAAVLLIGFSIGWPVLTTVRERSINAACANNLRSLAAGFSAYAGDFNGALPVASAGFVGPPFRVDAASLVRYRYCDHGHVNCPGHPDRLPPGYSSQLIRPGFRLMITSSPAIILIGDRNPVIDAVKSGTTLLPTSNSPNHGDRGQNLLRLDGATMWRSDPVLDGDNIWLVEGESEYRPGAVPADPQDVYLFH